jgi:hypothetical protein
MFHSESPLAAGPGHGAAMRLDMALRCCWLWACVALVSQLWRTVGPVIGHGVDFGAAMALVGGVAALGLVRSRRWSDGVAALV